MDCYSINIINPVNVYCQTWEVPLLEPQHTFYTIAIFSPILNPRSVIQSVNVATHPSWLWWSITRPSPVLSLQLGFPCGKSKSHFQLMVTSSKTAAAALTDSVSPGRRSSSLCSQYISVELTYRKATVVACYIHNGSAKFPSMGGQRPRQPPCAQCVFKLLYNHCFRLSD